MEIDDAAAAVATGALQKREADVNLEAGVEDARLDSEASAAKAAALPHVETSVTALAASAVAALAAGIDVARKAACPATGNAAGRLRIPSSDVPAFLLDRRENHPACCVRSWSLPGCVQVETDADRQKLPLAWQTNAEGAVCVAEPVRASRLSVGASQLTPTAAASRPNLNARSGRHTQETEVSALGAATRFEERAEIVATLARSRAICDELEAPPNLSGTNTGSAGGVASDIDLNFRRSCECPSQPSDRTAHRGAISPPSMPLSSCSASRASSPRATKGPDRAHISTAKRSIDQRHAGSSASVQGEGGAYLLPPAITSAMLPASTKATSASPRDLLESPNELCEGQPISNGTFHSSEAPPRSDAAPDGTSMPEMDMSVQPDFTKKWVWLMRRAMSLQAAIQHHETQLVMVPYHQDLAITPVHGSSVKDCVDGDAC